jgi:hypothetical protein
MPTHANVVAVAALRVAASAVSRAAAAAVVAESAAAWASVPVVAVSSSICRWRRVASWPAAVRASSTEAARSVAVFSWAARRACSSASAYAFSCAAPCLATSSRSSSPAP